MSGADVASETGSVRGLDLRRLVDRHGWTVGVFALLVALILYWRTIPAAWGTFDVQSLAIDALPFAFAAMAQAVVIISGGIDLSVGSLMGLMNVLSAKYMVDMSTREAFAFAVLLIAVAALAGALTGAIITVTRIADIIVTLAMLFVWAGVALLVLEVPAAARPGLPEPRGRHGRLAVDPDPLVVLLVVLLCFWTPIRWTKPGLAIYAIGLRATPPS